MSMGDAGNPTAEIPPGMFRCGMCGGLFELGPPGEAEAEAAAKGVDVATAGMVCDRCYAATPWGVTDVMVEAAYRKACKSGLFHPPGWPDGGKRDRRITRDIIEAALMENRADG